MTATTIAGLLRGACSTVWGGMISHAAPLALGLVWVGGSGLFPSLCSGCGWGHRRLALPGEVTCLATAIAGEVSGPLEYRCGLELGSECLCHSSRKLLDAYG